MIGLLAICIRTGTPASLVPEAYGPSRLIIPKAPGSGLMLLEPQYGAHNKHLEESNKRIDALVAKGTLTESAGADQKRDPVVLPESVLPKVEAFKKEWVYDKMYENDAENGPFASFIAYFDSYSGTDFESVHFLPSCCDCIN